MARHGYNRAVPPNTDYSGKCTAPTETDAEIQEHIKEKMALLDDFFVGRHKRTVAQKVKLKVEFESMQSIRAIDEHFRQYLCENL